MIFVGIDPGKGGGIAFIDESGHACAYSKMPATHRDVLDFFCANKDALGCTDAGRPIRAMLEQVHAIHGVGAGSNWTFGAGYGALQMALTAARIPFEEVPPKRWQKALGCQKAGKDVPKVEHKNNLKRRAQELFPDVEMTLALSDALLLAEYARRLELRL